MKKIIPILLFISVFIICCLLDARDSHSWKHKTWTDSNGVTHIIGKPSSKVLRELEEHQEVINESNDRYYVAFADRKWESYTFDKAIETKIKLAEIYAKAMKDYLIATRKGRWE